MIRSITVSVLTALLFAGYAATAEAAAPARPAPARTAPARRPVPAPVAPFIRSPITLYGNVQQAQAHCPRDAVAWLNIASGVYHTRGQDYYGRTHNGSYVCKAEADRAGFHSSMDGS